MARPPRECRSSTGSRPSLREQIADAVRAALVSGEMHAGIVYSAPTLAARFGVSATPVREALLDLAKEGLVGPVPNRGFRVAELSGADLDEIYTLRVLLEVPAVGQLVGVVDDAQLAALAPLAEAAALAAAQGDLAAYAEADRRFHLGLLGLLGNDRLVAIVRTLQVQARLSRYARRMHRDAAVASARDHHELLRLIAAGDAATAERLMRRHLVAGRVPGAPAG
jgi:DNA-binding GntR family transcriptional regulator